MKLIQQTPARLSVPLMAQDIRRLLHQRQARVFLLLSCIAHGLLLYLLIPILPHTSYSQNGYSQFNILLSVPTASKPDAIGPDKVEPEKPAPQQKTRPTGNSIDNNAANPPTPIIKKDVPLHSKPVKTPVAEPKNISDGHHSMNSPTASVNLTQAKQTIRTNDTANTSSNSPARDQSLVQPREIRNATQSYTQHLAQSQTRNQLHLALGQKVKDELRQYLSYPYLARKRGWSGKVMLGFQVDTDGKLLNIHLSESSGYTVLDNSALSAIQKVRRVTGLIQDLETMTPTIRIPVIFALQQG